MEFRRINGLPPYVFAQINGLKAQSRALGRDVIDFGFGNPDLPSPEIAVAKLAEAAHNPKNHRYKARAGAFPIFVSLWPRVTRCSLTLTSTPKPKLSRPLARRKVSRT